MSNFSEHFTNLSASLRKLFPVFPGATPPAAAPDPPPASEAAEASERSPSPARPRRSLSDPSSPPSAPKPEPRGAEKGVASGAAGKEKEEAMSALHGLIKTYFTDLPLTGLETLLAFSLLKKIQVAELEKKSEKSDEIELMEDFQFARSAATVPLTRFHHHAQGSSGDEERGEDPRSKQGGRTAGSSSSAAEGVGPILNPTSGVANLRTLLHFLHFSTATYGWQYVGVWAGAMGPLELIKALDSDHGNASAAISRVKVDHKDLLFYQFESGLYKPAHLMAVDHRSKSIVLAIRGSFAIEDALTDVVAHSERFTVPARAWGARKKRAANEPPGEGPPVEGGEGLAHMGMLKCAKWVVSDLAGAMELACERFNYKPVLVGHSLGAGVATLAGILLSERMPNISVYAFAPPCCVDVETAKSHWCREHVVSVVNESDIVPRLSLRTLDDLCAILVRLKERNNLYTSWLPLKPASDWHRDITPPTHAHDGDEGEGESSKGRPAAPWERQRPAALAVAGKIFHMTRFSGSSAAAPLGALASSFSRTSPSPSSGSASGTASSVEAATAHAPSASSTASTWFPWLQKEKLQLVEVQQEHFDRIILAGDIIADHFPNRYEDNLAEIIKAKELEEIIDGEVVVSRSDAEEKN